MGPARPDGESGSAVIFTGVSVSFFWNEFNDLQDNNTTNGQEAPWAAFVEMLAHREVSTKNQVGLWSPTKYLPGTNRSKAGVQALSAMMFDFDDVSEAYLNTLRDRIKGFEYVLHSTFGHLQTPNTTRVRVILPLARAASPAEWEATRTNFADAMEWQAVTEKSDVEGYDAQANHCATFFYWPSHAPGAEFIFEKNAGRLLEVDTSTKPKAKPAKKVETPAAAEFAGQPGVGANFLEVWGAVKKGAAAKAFAKYRDGKPISGAGGRDAAMQRDVSAIAEAMPYDELTTIDENIIIDFVAASIAATPAGDDGSLKTEDDFREKLRRARQWVYGQKGGAEGISFRKAMAKHARAPEPIAEEPIREDRFWPEELKAYLSQKHFDGGPLQLFLGFKRHFKVLSREGFGRWLDREEAINYAKQHETRYATKSFQYMKILPSGRETEATIYDLAEKHGKILEAVSGSFIGETRYNLATNSLIEVVNPIQKPKAHYHEEVDGFLRVFCKNEQDYPRLLAWLKRFPRLDQTSNILTLSGRKNTGKTMLGSALAGFWGKKTGITPESFFGSFQDPLLECPYVFADEGLPKRMTSSQTIRNMTTANSHSVNRKGLPRIDVAGHLRMVIATNDSTMKFVDDDLSADAIDAIDARLLKIEVSDDAGYYIAERGGREWTDRLVAGGLILQHVQWLSENYAPSEGITSDPRFPATNWNTRGSSANARMSNEYTEPLCLFLYRLLVDASYRDADAWRKGDIFFKAEKGKLKLFVSPWYSQDMLKWQFISTTKVPSIDTTSKILHSLSDEKSARNVRSPKGEQKKRWSIDLLKFKDHLDAVMLPTEKYVERIEGEIATLGISEIEWYEELPRNEVAA